ncbi:hypothetical protein PQC34_gp059 [Cronobacter phage A24]|uniref:Uncharacterized protein n=1 Tax=Cronobacter phage A24 TaxID=2795745 RepID=A0A7T5UF04_9CAUD|nr:hypothetical protein PQC34_gp059 [Cronobacter phage A24]QQG33675.1 hypothetical protein [Cronobacter phage A24]
MEEKQSVAEWCFTQRDLAFAEGRVDDGNNYQQLGTMWAEREAKKEA